ncbi:hypothetical protein EV193_104186 [Herbihabitans rhizosphaerae]|uniref:Uncharacterized protein n=1 Tax=Herbihabitans rhizosphaerae TaxID=1872711 RepID=A0A4Q7KQZ9_9PSEU|nr:hypothetical protein [Herbihabitans rhizosphaerae]RZS38975.1 hypothetical protein EV193_104186 [Herbihabitans rhizosphaerae]
MTNRIPRVLATTGVALALAAVPGVAQATPAPAAGTTPITIAAAPCPNPFWGLFCTRPYLATPFGPVSQATQLSGDGRARAGKYSPITGEFAPSTGWLRIIRQELYDLQAARATDGQIGRVTGYAQLSSPLGPAVWATQFQSGRGRWGVYNFATNLFYPEGNGAWSRLTN